MSDAGGQSCCWPATPDTASDQSVGRGGRNVPQLIDDDYHFDNSSRREPCPSTADRTGINHDFRLRQSSQSDALDKAALYPVHDTEIASFSAACHARALLPNDGQTGS